MISTRPVNLGLLTQRTDEVKAIVAEAESLGTRREAKLLDAGRVLCDIKAMLPHGQFQDHVSKVLGIDPRNARNWMKRYRESAGLPADPDLKTETVTVLTDEQSTRDTRDTDAVSDRESRLSEIRRRTDEINRELNPPLSPEERASLEAEAEAVNDSRGEQMAPAPVCLAGSGACTDGESVRPPLSSQGTHGSPSNSDATRLSGPRAVQLTLEREYQLAASLRRAASLIETHQLPVAAIAEIEAVLARVLPREGRS